VHPTIVGVFLCGFRYGIPGRAEAPAVILGQVCQHTTRAVSASPQPRTPHAILEHVTRRASDRSAADGVPGLTVHGVAHALRIVLEAACAVGLALQPAPLLLSELGRHSHGVLYVP
jgi:hypothetical protein